MHRDRHRFKHYRRRAISLRRHGVRPGTRARARRPEDSPGFTGTSPASPESVRDYLRLRLSGLEHEVFVTLFLDAQHRLIEAEGMFRGTLTQTSVHPREVVKAALRHNAAAVILAHNHPSGAAEPSRVDELLTAALKQTLGLVDVRTLDHFVVAGPVTVSFAERGLI